MKYLAKLTAEYDAGNGIYKPAHHSLNERISFKASQNALLGYHIKNCFYRNRPTDHKYRQSEYEVRCLEKGLRPYNYPEGLWQEYLRDILNEEHSNKYEAKNAWRYEY